MSRAVDEKIVKMSVENASFMSKVKETLTGLTSLSKGAEKIKGVDMSKADASVKSLSKSLAGVSMDKLAQGVEGIKSKFSTLGVVAITALQNITNRAVNAGLAMAKSFTTAPITEGLSMYENKLKSIQTILSNTQGKENLKSVTASLDDLNNYANKTVYSFEDMTTNMGTFTAAGVDLKTAQVAIKGIGNLAASSGSSTQQAGMAMYQLSQAIAAGKVGLQDWNSVVNAGMGGKKFQTALQNNAKAMGKNVDASKSFRDSLQDGWLTTDVLMKTLKEFANDKSMLKAATQVKSFSDLMDTLQDEMKSGWAKTWELIIGDFDQAPKLWTAVHDVLGKVVDDSANARNNLIKGFNEMGGRQLVLTTLQNLFNNLGRTLKAISQGFRDVFPAMTAKRLYELVQGFSTFIAKSMLTTKNLENIRKISSGVFSIFSIGIKVVMAIAKVFAAMIPDSMGGGILEVAGNVGEMITNFNKGLTPGNSFKKMLEGVHNTSNTVAKAIGSALSGIGKFGSWLISIGKTIKSAVAPAFEGVAKAIGGFVKSISFKDVLGASGIGVLAIAVHKFGKIKDSIVDFMDKIMDVLTSKKEDVGILDTLKESLSNLTTGLKVATLVEIAAAVTALAISLKLLSTIKGGDLAKSLEAMIISLVALSKASDAISKLDFNKGAALKGAITITALANAVLVMSAALKVMSTIDGKDMAKSLAALATTVALLVGAVTLMSKAGGKMSASSLQIGALAVAILTISAALKVMSGIKASSLAKSLIALGIVLVELAGFVALVNKQKLNPSTAAGVLAVSAALLIISGAMTVMARIKADDIVKGLGAMAGILAEVVAFTKLMQGSSVLGAAVGLTSVAVAMNLMVIPMAAFGAMSWESIAKGLVTVGVALGEVVAAMALANGSLAGAAAITLVAAALNLLVPPIVMLGHLSIGQLAIALGGLAGVFTIIAVASIPLSAGAIGLLAFAAAIGAIGLAVLAIGVGLAAFTTALVTLASMTVSQVGTIVNNFNGLITGLGKTIPAIVQLIVNAVVSIAAGIAKAAPSIANSGLQLISGLLQAIATNLPAILGSGLQIVVELINGLAQGLPQLIAAGTNLVLSFINGLANSIRDNGPLIVQAIMNLIESIAEIIVTAFTTILDTLLGWIPGFSNTIGKLGSKATSALRATFKVGQVSKEQMNQYLMAIKGAIPGAQTAALKVVNGVIKGMSTGKQKAVVQALASGMSYKKALTSTTPGVAAAAKGLGQTAWNNAKKDLRGQGSNAGGTYKTGISSKKGSVSSAAKDLANAGKNGVKKTDWSEAGKHAGEGFGRGIKHATSAVVGFAQGLAHSAVGALKKWLKIKSPSRVTMVVGDFFGQGFGKGIEKQGKNVIKKATDMASAAVDAISSQAGAIQDAMNDNLSLQPVVTPVLDTSNLQGSTDLSGTIAASASITANGKPLVANQTYQFGDIKIDIQSPDAQTADMTMKTFKTMFKSALTDELREVKVTR